MDTSYLPKSRTYYPVETVIQGVVNSVEPGEAQPLTKMDERMEPLIWKLAARHPEWLFLVSQRRIRESCFRGFAYGYNNDRLAKSRKRYGNAKTMDLNKAVKGIEKMFYTKTDSEVFAEGVKELKDICRQIFDRLENKADK